MVPSHFGWVAILTVALYLKKLSCDFDMVIREADSATALLAPILLTAPGVSPKECL